MTSPDDLELLTIQTEGSLDARGRVVGARGVRIACSEGGQALFVGAEVPDAVADELESVFAHAPRSARPSEPPPALAACARILEGLGPPLAAKGGPSYLFERWPSLTAPGHIVGSGGVMDVEPFRRANPGNWDPVEWDELLDGRLGPFTLGVEHGRVVSICHTPRPLTARVAECGVWTDAAFRGRGHAAAVTAAWAAHLRPTGRHLFYSTDHDNTSSQRVASRLGLRPLGFTWALVRPPEPDDALHPLCSLRSRR